MYDFCFSPLYATALLVGGLWTQTLEGLAFGGGAAAALALLSYVSLKYYRRGHLCKPATTASLAVALSVGAVFWGRYRATGEVAPAGCFAALSLAMAAFYAWSLALGPAPGKRPPAAAAAAAKKAALGKQ